MVRHRRIKLYFSTLRNQIIHEIQQTVFIHFGLFAEFRELGSSNRPNRQPLCWPKSPLFIQVGQKSDTSRTYITLYERYHFFGPPGIHDLKILMPINLLQQSSFLLIKESIFKRGLENELVLHPLHIWFVTSGCLGRCPWNISCPVVQLNCGSTKNYSLFSSRVVNIFQTKVYVSS